MNALQLIHLHDLHDPRLDNYRSLKLNNQTRSLDHFVVEGSLLVERLIHSRFAIESILTNPDWIDQPRFELPHDVPIYLLDKPSMTNLVGFSFHQGILASGKRRPWPPIEEILNQSRSPVQTLVICPAIDNPENLGSIARTAEALGVSAIIVGKESPDPLSRRMTRVSMGASLKLPILEYPDIHPVLEKIRSLGFQFIATSLDANCNELINFQRPDKVALFLGREREGLDQEFLRMADHCLTISMTPGTDSLNVSVAAGIFLYFLNQPYFSGKPENQEQSPEPSG